MSLPTLNWRKLPTRTLLTDVEKTVNNVLNNVYDMLTGSLYLDGSERIPGTGSAWSASARFITGSGTGSNTEALFCTPPVLTVMSQSVIIGGVNIAGAKTAHSLVSLTTNQTLPNSGSFYMACVKNAAGPLTASNWYSSSATFGSGSESTKYANFYVGPMATATVLKISIYESQEALGLFFSIGGTTNFGGFAGAIIDPEQTVTSGEAEADNRIYAIATSQPASTGLSSNFWGQHDGGTTYFNGIFLDHCTSATKSRMVMMNPQTGSLRSISCAKVAAPVDSNYATITGKLPKTSLLVIAADNNTGRIATGPFVGRLRDITMSRDFANNLIIRDASNNIVGFTISYSENTTANAVLLPY